MVTIRRISFVLFFIALIVTGWLGLATPLLTVLFSYFALELLDRFKRKWVAVSLFMICVFAIFYGFVFFVREAFKTLPIMAETSIPIAIDYAEKHGVDLPFSDIHSLKALTVEEIKGELGEVAKFTQIVTKEFVFLLIGLVVAISIFLNGQIDLGEGTYTTTNNLYSLISNEIAKRFYNFYRSFSTVMGAQLVISTINTLFTSIFVFVAGIPYAHVVVVITFLCGLLPIVGNLISNTIICGVALSKSPTLAGAALVFLIAIHKAEYFLNSKIIGGRIKNPMWLTLLGLIVGERLMGIPGMILAPVVLHYIKLEGSQIEVKIPEQLQPVISLK